MYEIRNEGSYFLPVGIVDDVKPACLRRRHYLFGRVILIDRTWFTVSRRVCSNSVKKGEKNLSLKIKILQLILNFPDQFHVTLRYNVILI